MIHTITGILLLVFLVVYFQDRRKVSNGFFLSLFLLSLYFSFAYEALTTRPPVIFWLFIVITILGILFLLFGGFSLMVFFFINARILFKKEGFRLRNSLTLAVGLGILLLFIFSLFPIQEFIPEQLSFLFTFSIFCIQYISFFFIEFFISSMLYQVYFPKYDKDFIVVLGSGLINGDQVPPLLQSRINKALFFYRKQIDKADKRAKIIFSGGQGPNETISEAEAMAKFALTQELPQADMIIENQSVNTEENMRFSKQKMEELAADDYQVVYVTNSFHLLRAGMYAKRAGLKAQGIGSKTAFYFWPNAFIREFIAYMVLFHKVHLIVLSIVFVFLLSVALLLQLVN
ncbi:YdcF family protein [Desemzia sp. RIT804]|uniref:YdcF family protein n=1 Tax=Desemzia sp. RIT 804 TaxID=2810209 RepID=UPI0019515B36|nr:YdcF family protein [Desemzia sp. RIT 804]MBM6614901.1 YdcF family protein [Desemzia sp. RIT 804]